MDQGVNFGFSSQGIDPATFGVPNWDDGWHKVVIIGSAAKPLSDATKGGRMQFKIKCIEGPMAGKEHFIGLNLYHNEPDTRKRAEQEMASICHVTGKYAFQNTAELYNIPFYVLAETTTSSPTPAYPNPKPQTNFRGYRDINGNEPGKSGQGGGMPGNGGPPANFGQPPQGGAPAFGAPQFGQQPGAQPGFQPGGAPQGSPGGFNPNPAPGFNPGAPAFQPGQPQQQPGGWMPPNGGGAPGAQPGGFVPPNDAPQTGFPGQPNGGNAQFPSNGAPAFNPQGGPAPGFAPQGQPQFVQPGQAPQWGPQGGAPAQPGGWNPNG